MVTQTRTDASSIAPACDMPGLTREQMSIVHNWLAQAVGVDRERLAFAVFVEVSEGRYRRRLYLSLASAQAAVERAEARGVDARAVMCQLVPVRGEQ